MDGTSPSRERKRGAMADYQEFLDGLDRAAYHEGELTWEEDGFTVTRTYQYSPPGCHDSCGVLFYAKDGKLDHVEGDPLSPFTNGKLCMRCLDFIGKIEIAPSLPPDEYQTAEADIVMADGTAYHARCDVPKGDIYQSPMSEEEVLDKFYRNIEFSQTLSREDADRVVQAVSRLEELDDVHELTQFMK